ncbi:MAG: tail fiber domain-containing protein [Bdellovibrionaceae bacterium]|nr:tail fiber domain-containing protein [Pseudobdellovibrionaceae bacterium]
MKTKLVFTALILVAPSLSSADAGVTFRGRLLQPDGNPVTASSVQFRVQIRTPDTPNCLMYEEIQSKDLSHSAGVFSVTLNDGTAVSGNVEPFSLEDAFSKVGTVSFATGKCSSGHSTSLTSTSGRSVQISFNDGSFAGWEPLPALSTSFAGQALAAASVEGVKRENIFRVEDAGVLQSIPSWTLTAYNKLLGIVNGTEGITGNAAGFTGALAGDVTGSQGTTSVVALRGQPVSAVTPVTGQVLTWDGSTWKASAAANGLPTAIGVAGKFLRSSGSSWSGQDILFSDIKNSMGSSAFSVAACGANQTVKWSSLTDQFQCQNIGDLDASTVTGGLLDIARLPAAVTDALWVTGGGHIARPFGNVGIGTNSPAFKLDVVGNARVSAGVLIEGPLTMMNDSEFRGAQLLKQGTPGAVQVRLFDESGVEHWHQSIKDGSMVLRNYQTSTDVLTLAPTGSLEVPRLQVRASDTTASRAFLSTYGSGVKSSLVLQRSNGTQASPFEVQFGDNLGEIVWNGAVGTNGATKPGAWIFSTATENWSPATTGTKMLFGVTPTGSTQSSPVPQMALAEQGLGIGTVNPQAHLHIQDASPRLRLQDSDASPSAKIEFWNHLNTAVGFLGFEGSNNLVLETSSSTHAMGLRTNGVERITISPNGYVGIGKVTPLYKLDVDGDVNVSGTFRANGLVYLSDIHYKKNIEGLEGSLDKLLVLEGVSYLWRRDEFPEKNFSSRRQIGLIAQEVETQFPELIEQDSAGYKAVNYAALVAPIIEAIRELYHKYVSQEERLAQQDRKIQDLEKAISELRRDVACQKDAAADGCR